MGRKLTAIGMMSGTSLDGVDAAALTTDGAEAVEPGPALIAPYGDDARAAIKAATAAALDGRLDAPEIATAAEATTDAHIAAVRALLAQGSLAPEDVDVIGFHGQTILHRPAPGRAGEGVTLQIGDAARMASELGIDVIADFRSADVAAGGEGAPLLPVYHAALVQGLARDDAVVVFNLGGVANVTFCPPGDGDLIAFDSGPGNGMIDLWVEKTTGAAMDADGQLARTGAVNEAALQALLDHSYFDRPPPKSLDRYDFTLDPLDGLSAADGAATLVAFTAETLARSVAHFPAPPGLWVAAGGGRLNSALMAAIKERLGGAKSAEDVGWRGDDLEAEGFAYMAVRSLYGLPISFPKTTGAPEAMTGGRLFRASG